MSFGSDLKNFKREFKEVMEDDRKAITLKLFNSVIMATPVDTGRARGNWHTTTGGPSTAQSAREDKVQVGSPGGQAMAEAEQVILNSVFGDSLHLTNNLPYILPLEYGHSSQMPAGMVRQSVARIDAIIKETLNQ